MPKKTHVLMLATTYEGDTRDLPSQGSACVVVTKSGIIKIGILQYYAFNNLYTADIPIIRCNNVVHIIVHGDRVINAGDYYQAELLEKQNHACNNHLSY